MSDYGNSGIIPKVPTFLDPLWEQKILLFVFGLFVVLPSSFIGTMVSYEFFGHSAVMAYVGGFSVMMFVGGTLGFFTVLIRQAVQQVQIKVVESKE